MLFLKNTIQEKLISPSDKCNEVSLIGLQNMLEQAKAFTNYSVDYHCITYRFHLFFRLYSLFNRLCWKQQWLYKIYYLLLYALFLVCIRVWVANSVLFIFFQALVLINVVLNWEGLQIKMFIPPSLLSIRETTIFSWCVPLQFCSRRPVWKPSWVWR